MKIWKIYINMGDNIDERRQWTICDQNKLTWDSRAGWSNHEAEGKLEDPFSADIEDSLLTQNITIFHVFYPIY